MGNQGEGVAEGCVIVKWRHKISDVLETRFVPCTSNNLFSFQPILRGFQTFIFEGLYWPNTLEDFWELSWKSNLNVYFLCTVLEIFNIYFQILVGVTRVCHTISFIYATLSFWGRYFLGEYLTYFKKFGVFQFFKTNKTPQDDISSDVIRHQIHSS